MEHLFLFRSQVPELKMRQIVEERTLGRHTIESAMAKYQVLPRKTVIQCLERVRQKESAPNLGSAYRQTVNLFPDETTPSVRMESATGTYCCSAWPAPFVAMDWLA